MSSINEKKWKITVDPRHPANTVVTYKGEPVGLIRGLDFCLSAGNTFPSVKFEVFMSNVEIETLPLLPVTDGKAE